MSPAWQQETFVRLKDILNNTITEGPHAAPHAAVSCSVRMLGEAGLTLTFESISNEEMEQGEAEFEEELFFRGVRCVGGA